MKTRFSDKPEGGIERTARRDAPPSRGRSVLTAAWLLVVPASPGRAAPADAASLPPAAVLSASKDPSIPVEERMAGITVLAGKAGRADSASIAALMTLGNERTYLRWAAVEALGTAKGPSVESYLKARLADPDAQIASAAMRSYARVAGERALAGIASALRANRAREDGLEEGVSIEAATILGDMRSNGALPILEDELGALSDRGWSLEYGSSLIAALRKIGDPAASGSIERYILRLRSGLPENAGARRYFEDKIDEAQRALDALNGR